MGLSSMTGFARAEGRAGPWSWVWEAKSVNGKGLDVRCRLPPGFESLEQPLRQRVAGRLGRGNIYLNLTLARSQGQASLRINQAALDQIVALLPELRQRLPTAEPPRLDGLLALRGVMEAADDLDSEEARRDLDQVILGDLDAALDSLRDARSQEGGRLREIVGDQIDGIADLCRRAETLAATQPEAIRERLRSQIAALLEASPALPEERLAQEAALLASKADIREELDRLGAHVAAARQLMEQDDAVGRRLDFLCQEFNREANTLCSKSWDVALTRLGLELKATVEQVREQVQNIE